MLTYAVQKVGDALPLEPQGPTDFNAFRHAIDAFPWAAEHAKWDERQEGPFPALVLQRAADQRELWVTALGADVSVDFEVQSVSMRLSKSFFGKAKMKQDWTALSAYDRAEVDRLCQLFCDAQYEALDREADRLAARTNDG